MKAKLRKSLVVRGIGYDTGTEVVVVGEKEGVALVLFDGPQKQYGYVLSSLLVPQAG